MKISLEAIQEIFKGRTEIELCDLVAKLSSGRVETLDSVPYRKQLIADKIQALWGPGSVPTIAEFVSACDKLVDLAEKYYEHLSDGKHTPEGAAAIAKQFITIVIDLAVRAQMPLQDILFEGMDCGMEQYAAADTLQEVLDRIRRENHKILTETETIPERYRDEIEAALAECVATVISRGAIGYFEAFAEGLK